MQHPSIYIQNTANKGRGVFTSTRLDAETTIEEAPVIVMGSADRKLLDQTLLHDYIFEWQPDGQDLCCMALGWVPIYNHANRSNCEYFMDYEAGTIEIKTVRNIEAGEELTINYNGDWDEDASVWFEMKE